MGTMMWLALALGAGFLAYLIYTRQFGWLIRVARNMALGVGGMLIFNLMLSGFGLTVGINVITTLVVGLLGAPGFLLLYGTQMIVG
ncbi:MAG: pro-sigmaK processing inhibitor BofA family protein [Defluviitaleaceae bacterium]|nr:pro-sigmaK processing inhibitor BofA family protein [Defluviitaleaceae bacterium]